MKRFQVTVNGNSYEVEVEELASGQAASPRPAAPVAPTAAPASSPEPAQKPAANVPAGAEKVTAPMPGSIINVNVTNGQSVEEGDLICTLEAMKMENEVFASVGGTVASINVSPGDTVETGDVIVTLN